MSFSVLIKFSNQIVRIFLYGAGRPALAIAAAAAAAAAAADGAAAMLGAPGLTPPSDIY